MITVYPIAAVAGSPLYSGRMLRQTAAVNLAGATSVRPLGARSGVRPGTSTATVTATSTTWFVNPHAGVLDLEVPAEAGPYKYSVDAQVGGTVTAAHATLARVDIVYMRLDDPPEDSSPLPLVAAGYLAGVAGSGLPPATPARCMVLAWINVPASGGGSPTTTWKALYAVAAGADIPVRTTAERDLITWGTAECPATVILGGSRQMNAGAGWYDVAGFARIREIPVTVSGTTGTSPLDIAAAQAIPASPFGASPYTVRINASMSASVPAGLGIQLDVLFDGFVSATCKMTNSGGTANTMTVSVDRTLPVIDSAPHTIRVVFTPLAGSVFIPATPPDASRYFEIQAFPYKAF